MDKKTEKDVLAKKRKVKRELDWHTAFAEVLQDTFIDYSDVLRFEFEYPLNTKPLEIDVIVIKKKKNITIKLSIAVIFRKFNIVEYKNPNVSLSITGFHKCIAYVRLYCTIKKVKLTDTTLTFVISRYPRKLFQILKTEFNYQIENTSPGVYNIKGDVMPIQIIDTRLLNEDNYFYLKNLRSNIELEKFEKLLFAIHDNPQKDALQAFENTVILANHTNMEELKMSRQEKLLQILREAPGLKEDWIKAEARGKAIAYKEVGLPISEIAKKTGLSQAEIRKL
jgi:hypothetical protein